jgi:phage repressor protein C with HTH and peptisase S24 domain
MAPTLSSGDVVLVRRGRTPRSGDVALVVWAARPRQLSVKRVVEARDGGWFVVGDNPFGSTDSRELGAADVLGVVTCRLWPRPGRLSERRP